MYNTRMEERSLQTLKAMLNARGIKAENFDPVGGAMDETRMFTFGGILIIFSDKTRVTASEFKNFITFASENNFVSGIIIVTPTKPSESILQLVRDYISDEKNPLLQIFYQSHLNFDISKHRKVPAHRIVMNEELPDILKTWNVPSPASFPKIDSQDAMAKWIGARPGNIIEIKGLCVTSAENTRYRYCVANVTDV